MSFGAPSDAIARSCFFATAATAAAAAAATGSLLHPQHPRRQAAIALL